MVKVKKVSGKVAKKSVAAVKKEVKKVNINRKISKVKKTAKETSRKVKQQLLRTNKQKREETLKKVCEGRGVVYIKHIPHGFYEKEMYEYFKQFGRVTAIKLPRSKNGKSKGFAFIEFEYKEIAKIVADTMNNYLMFNQLLKTEYIPPEKQKPHFFHRASMPWDDSTNKDAADRRREMDRVNKNKPILDPVAFVKKTQSTVKKIRDTLLKKTGFDYEFQVNEPEIEKVQLIGAKRRSRDPTPINDVKPTPKKTKPTPSKTKPTPRKTKAMPRKTKVTPKKTKATPRKTKNAS